MVMLHTINGAVDFFTNSTPGMEKKERSSQTTFMHFFVACFSSYLKKKVVLLRYKTAMVLCILYSYHPHIPFQKSVLAVFTLSSFFLIFFHLNQPISSFLGLFLWSTFLCCSYSFSMKINERERERDGEQYGKIKQETVKTVKRK